MSKKFLIIILVLGVLLLGAMGGTLYLVWTKLAQVSGGGEEGEEVMKSIKEEEEGEEEEKKGKKGKKEEVKANLRLDTFIVNLADPEGNKYLRVTMELELTGEQAQQEVEKKLAAIRDIVLNILPTKKSSEITSLEGKQQLKTQLMENFNKVLKKGKVTNIYYTEFVIQ